MAWGLISKSVESGEGEHGQWRPSPAEGRAAGTSWRLGKF